MENTIPTAEEILIQEGLLLKTIKESGNFPLNLTRDTHIGSAYAIKRAMITFAKLHVEAALEAAYYNAEFKEAGLEDEDICSTFNSDYDVVLVLDKESILESYPPENIK